MSIKLTEKFKWAISLKEDEIKEIWNTGILTVDANVLLDLYRYHQKTRESIIYGLRMFKERIWISHQASTEFFRNRTKVIYGVEKDFERIQDEIKSKLYSEFEKVLQSNSITKRYLPNELKDKFQENLGENISDFVKELKKQNKKDFDLLNDPILKEIDDLFGDNIGEDFEEKEKPEMLKEAEKRIKEKIPPGYKDDDKDGNRRYGDFFLWKQILKYGKQVGKPIIFITSEQKSDWWEEISGQTTGLLPSLKKEAWDEMGHPLVAYQTERFLDYSKQKLSSEPSRNNKDKIKKLEDAIKEVESYIKEINLHNKISVVNNKRQTTNLSFDEYQTGTIGCTIKRPINRFTISGKLEPEMTISPQVNAKLIQHPEMDIDYTIIAKTGTTYDFNIHIKASNNEDTLPVGDYVFEFEAYVDDL
jgi:hypothetical protein